MSVKISACIVTYHDEIQIERCLKSISQYVDEIVVVHDGPCTDATLDIARKYTKKVYVGQRTGNPEPHRVTTFEKATHDWLLILDPDEYLPKKTAELLHTLVDSGKADSYTFLWRLWDGEKYLTDDWPYRVGLVKKDKLRFLAILHPEWRVDGTTIEVPVSIEHRPSYNNYSWKSFTTKWLKWRRIHAQQILTPVKKIENFQYDRENLLPHLEWIKNWDVAAAPFIFVYFFLGALIRAPKKVGRFYVWFAFLQAAYYVMLCVEVWKLKHR